MFYRVAGFDSSASPLESNTATHALDQSCEYDDEAENEHEQE